MQHLFGLEIPRTLEEVCDPKRIALVVYDMQVGILSQLPNGKETLSRVVEVLEATRMAGIRVFFTRHMSLPNEMAGVYQLRTAMAWQRVDRVEQVRPTLLR